MPTLKPIKSCYVALVRLARYRSTHETGVRAAFQAILEHCARQCNWPLVLRHTLTPFLHTV